MTKEKLIENLKKHFIESGWCLDVDKIQKMVLVEIEKDLDQLIESSKNCGCSECLEPIDFAAI